MVKNTKGGNRHKKMARKYANEDEIKIKTRLANPNEPCEIYATVTNMYGQGNCEVLCNDNVRRLCVIRKIFKGRNKSSNRITVDTKVLVGLRDWETTQAGKREKCDLLEVYDRNQHKDIKKDPKCDWNVIATSVEKELIKGGSDEGFEFISNFGDINRNENDDNDDNVEVNYSNDLDKTSYQFKNTTSQVKTDQFDIDDINFDDI